MAALARIYVFAFENVTVSAVQDLLYVKASSTNGIEIRRVSLSASGVTSPAEIRLRLKRLAGSVSAGSGGTAPSINKVHSSNPTAALSAVRANDTTQATSSSPDQSYQLANWNWNVLQDFIEQPATLEERWGCQASEALIVDVIATPASTVLSGFMIFEET